MPLIAFAREELTDDLWIEALPLLGAHWREIATFPDVPLAPDMVAYAAASFGGMLRVYTARDEGHLVGYGLFFVRFALHYRESLQAVQDVFYLAPEARGGTGYRFLTWCDEQLIREGVSIIHHHVKVAHDWTPLLERLGYVRSDLIMSRKVG